jgi:hypothetical protein
MSDYVAKKPLYLGHTLIRKAGDTVSADLVEQYGWHDDVERAHRAPKDEEAKPKPKAKAKPKPTKRR